MVNVTLSKRRRNEIEILTRGKIWEKKEYPFIYLDYMRVPIIIHFKYVHFIIGLYLWICWKFLFKLTLFIISPFCSINRTFHSDWRDNSTLFTSTLLFIYSIDFIRNSSWDLSNIWKLVVEIYNVELFQSSICFSIKWWSKQSSILYWLKIKILYLVELGFLLGLATSAWL